MKTGDILIKRTRLGWFTTELLNLRAGDTLVYRRVVDFHPDRDQHREYAQGTAQVAAVREFIAEVDKCKIGHFTAKGVVDGVSYQIYPQERQLSFFCPAHSPDSEVRALGAALEKLFGQFSDDKLT